MKKINNFIQEKLKVNSKTNIQSTIFEEILEYWGLKYEKKDINFFNGGAFCPGLNRVRAKQR